MEIKEVIEKKKELAEKILFGMMNFEKETGCEISDVFLERCQVMGEKDKLFSCSLEIKL